MNERMTPTERACGCRVEKADGLAARREFEAVRDARYSLKAAEFVRWYETRARDPKADAHITYCATHSAAPAMQAALEEQCPGCKAKEQLVEHADGWWHHGAHWPWQCRNSDAARTALRSATPDDARRGEGAAG